MSSTLASKFMRRHQVRIDVGGRSIHSVCSFAVHHRALISVQRVSSSPQRAQALKLAADRGDLRVNGINANAIALWSHTSPALTAVEVLGHARSIDVWNAWSFEGVDSSWLGNAGMELATTGAVHTLRCSDGVGPIDFDDLVIELTIANAKDHD